MRSQLLLAMAALLLLAGIGIGHQLQTPAHAEGHWVLATNPANNQPHFSLEEANAYLQTLDGSCDIQPLMEPHGIGIMLIVQKC